MILLDTNALLWLYRDDDSLGRNARTAIIDADRVCFSAASVMEIMIKHLLGRLELPGDGDVADRFSRSGLAELPFAAAHAEALGRFPALARHDPFDRMLLAQAAVERMTLLTSDGALLSLGESWIRDARR